MTARGPPGAREVVVCGVGMTPIGRHPDRSMKALVAEAVSEAVGDAGAGARRLGAVYFANSFGGRLQGQDAIRGQVWLAEAGLSSVPVVNVENACASGSTALHLAWLAVGSGYVDAALVVGAEKLYDAERSGAAALSGAVDQEHLEGLAVELGAEAAKRSIFMDIYARWVNDYAEATGATREDFARVAVKNHDHGARNPKAQYRRTFTIDEVLGDREVVGPLTVPMCAPIGDGAAAAIVTTREVALRWGAEPVTLAAVEIGAPPDGSYGQLVRHTAQRAYERAGIGPEDVDVAECHDAVAPAELIVMEELGLCPPGEAPAMVASGATRIGSLLPINPSGGLESRGHPVGATGIAQVVELVDQLRGRAGDRQAGRPLVGLAENAGGYLGPDAAVATVTVLVR